MHILHSLPAALIQRGNIDPVHKIMQHNGRQFLQVGIFLRPEDELFNAVGLFLLPGNLLLPELHLFRQLRLLLFVVSGQFLKSAVVDFAGDVILIEPLEQAVKIFHPALCLRELSALCGEFFLEVLLTALHSAYCGTDPHNRRYTKAGFARISTRLFPEQPRG